MSTREIPREELEKAARFAGFLNADSYLQYLALVAEHDALRAAVRDYLKANSKEDGASYEQIVKLIKLSSDESGRS